MWEYVCHVIQSKAYLDHIICYARKKIILHGFVYMNTGMVPRGGGGAIAPQPMILIFFFFLASSAVSYVDDNSSPTPL